MTVAAVESSVNYLDDMDEMPVFYAQKQENNLKLSAHRIRIENARALQPQLSRPPARPTSTIGSPAASSPTTSGAC